MFRQDLGTGKRPVLMVSPVLIAVVLIENTLHTVIQGGLDAATIEFGLEYRVDLGNVAGLIATLETRCDFVKVDFTERETGIY